MTTSIINLTRTPNAQYDIYIGRPSQFGNPFSHKEGTLAKYKVRTRKESIEKYRAWILEQPHLLAQLETLRDKTLACFCVPQKCHGEILIELLSLNGLRDS